MFFCCHFDVNDVYCFRVVLRTNNPMDAGLDAAAGGGATAGTSFPQQQPGGQMHEASTGHSNYGWAVDGKAADQLSHPAAEGGDAAKFQRYPSLGSPNISTAPFYFNIG